MLWQNDLLYKCKCKVFFALSKHRKWVWRSILCDNTAQKLLNVFYFLRKMYFLWNLNKFPYLSAFCIQFGWTYPEIIHSEYITGEMIVGRNATQTNIKYVKSKCDEFSYVSSICCRTNLSNISKANKFNVATRRIGTANGKCSFSCQKSANIWEFICVFHPFEMEIQTIKIEIQTIAHEI